MTGSDKRDAKADLAVCAAATPGLKDVAPGSITDWDYATSTYTTEFTPNRCVSREQAQNDLQLFALARTALPHWIERATAAEAEVERLRVMLAARTVCPYCGETCLFAGRDEVYCEFCGVRWKWQRQAKGGTA